VSSPPYLRQFRHALRPRQLAGRPLLWAEVKLIACWSGVGSSALACQVKPAVRTKPARRVTFRWRLPSLRHHVSQPFPWERLPFQQTSAPTGSTKDTTHNKYRRPLKLRAKPCSTDRCRGRPYSGPYQPPFMEEQHPLASHITALYRKTHNIAPSKPNKIGRSNEC
jgi:hypothetical protein